MQFLSRSFVVQCSLVPRVPLPVNLLRIALVKAATDVHGAARALVTRAYTRGAQVCTRVGDAVPDAAAGAPDGAHLVANEQQTAGVLACETTRLE